MTRDEAIEILESVSFFAPSDIDVDTALDMAIEALERKRGEWIVQDGKVVCSECFEPNIETNYCPNCGADMRERREDDKGRSN